MDTRIVEDVLVGDVLFDLIREIENESNEQISVVPILWLDKDGRVIDIDFFPCDDVNNVPTKSEYLVSSGLLLGITKVHRQENWDWIGIIEAGVDNVGIGWCENESIAFEMGRGFPESSDLSIDAIYSEDGENVVSIYSEITGFVLADKMSINGAIYDGDFMFDVVPFEDGKTYIFKFTEKVLT